MRAVLTGDFRKLSKIGEAVGKLGGSSAMTALSRELGDEGVMLVARGFQREQDPYGIPWARKRYPDGRKVLSGATRKLARSFSVRVVGPWGVSIGSSLGRSRFPQSGTGIYGPKRKRIASKSGKALRFKSSSGGVIFRRSVRGQKQRRMVPVLQIQSTIWNRALRKRARDFLSRMVVGAVKRAA